MDQRRWEFETGYGLEGTLPDAILKRIGEDDLVPNLKKKEYAVGFENVISAVSRKIKNEPEPIEETSTPILDSKDKNLGPFTSVPLVPSAGVIWGPLHTFALLITGWLLGNSLAYFGGKYLGKYLVSKILGQQKLNSWVQVLEKRLNFFHLLLFRVATPSETGYIFGILNYSFKKYLALTLIAELPFAYITVYASQAFTQTGWSTFIYLGALWIAIIYFAATLFQKKVATENS
jgi:uncharacterized membrane protein YgcG